MGLCGLSWDSANLGEFTDISRFGESNSRLVMLRESAFKQWICIVIFASAWRSRRGISRFFQSNREFCEREAPKRAVDITH